MQINVNVSLQAPAKLRLQEQRAQQTVQATAKPRWQEQHANEHKRVTKRTCKAPVGKAACTTNSSICKALMARAAGI